jgi:hypothetical protein
LVIIVGLSRFFIGSHSLVLNTFIHLFSPYLFAMGFAHRYDMPPLQGYKTKSPALFGAGLYMIGFI